MNANPYTKTTYDFHDFLSSWGLTDADNYGILTVNSMEKSNAVHR